MVTLCFVHLRARYPFRPVASSPHSTHMHLGMQVLRSVFCMELMHWPDCTKALFESALLRVFDMLVNCNNLCFECFVCLKLQCKIWRHHNSLHLAASAVWSSNSLLCMHFSDVPFVSVIDDFVSEGFYHIPHDDFHAWHTLKSVLQCQWPRPRFLAVHICIRMVAPFVQPCWVPNAPSTLASLFLANLLGCSWLFHYSKTADGC